MGQIKSYTADKTVKYVIDLNTGSKWFRPISRSINLCFLLSITSPTRRVKISSLAVNVFSTTHIKYSAYGSNNEVVYSMDVGSGKWYGFTCVCDVRQTM